MAGSTWSNVNTCLEIGIEICRIMEETGAAKGAAEGAEVEKIANGVLLISNDKEVIVAVKKDIAIQALSDAAVAYGTEKGEYLCYNGAAAAIPLYELSRSNDDVRDYIISEESLRATLCGNYPEYVKTHNMSAYPGDKIEDADAPPYLFLQKQLDNESDNIKNEVSAFQEKENVQAREPDIFDEEWEIGD